MRSPVSSGCEAGVGARVIAFLVDLAVLGATFVVALVWMGATRDVTLAMEQLRTVAEGWAALVILVYFATLESWGGTAGKRLLALCVETSDGEPVGYFRALWRNVAKAGSLLLFPIAIACALSTTRKQSLHDILSGTVVRRVGSVAGVAHARQRTRVAAAAVIVLLLPLAEIILVQRYGRMLYDAETIQETASAMVGQSLEAFPDIDGNAFFRDQHARCFGLTYAPSWTWNHFDRPGYLRCLSRGYVAQTTQALVIEDPAWVPHSSPGWARLEFTVRLKNGRLPEKMQERTITQCDGGSTSSGSGAVPRTAFREITPGVYRSHTLVGPHKGSCRLHFGLLSGRWLLSPPLVVPLPTPDPVLMQAEEEARQRGREAQQRTWQCILAAKAALPPMELAYTDEGTDPLSDAVRRLRSSDVSIGQDGAMALKKLGPPARSAIGELVRSLGNTNENSKDYLIQALVAVDPGGTAVVPALRCLAGEPKPSVRIWAGAALMALNDPAGLAILEKEIQSPEEHVRLSVVRAIRDASTRGLGALALLVAHLQSDPSIEVRTACVSALPWLDPHSEKVIAALKAALRDPAPEVREAAMSSLHHLPSFQSRPRYPATAP